MALCRVGRLWVVPCPDLPTIRRYRLGRSWSMRWPPAHLGGILMFDPLNIRYATDSTKHCSWWNTAQPVSRCLVWRWHMVLWDYKNSPFLADHKNPWLPSALGCASMFYFANGGPRRRMRRRSSPGMVAEIMPAHASTKPAAGRTRSAPAPGRPEAAGSLEGGRGTDGTGPVFVNAPTKILAMRCAVHAAEIRPLRAMENAIAPGKSEGRDLGRAPCRETSERGGEWIRDLRAVRVGRAPTPGSRKRPPRGAERNETRPRYRTLWAATGLYPYQAAQWWTGSWTPPAPRTGRRDDPMP